jgi:RNA methyltransferase, TrmH family
MKLETRNSKLVTSRDNSLLRQARAVRDGKTEELIFVEGLRLSEEALRSGLKIEAVIYSEEIVAKERAARFLKEVAGVCNRLVSVSEKLLETISYTKTPQGIVTLAVRPEWGQLKLERNEVRSPLLVVMHGVNNPVNLGAILRSAEAAGSTGVITTANTADPFSAKALRGAMGSAFRLPIWTGLGYSQVLNWCDENQVKTISADVNATKLYTNIDWKIPRALILGTESSGLTPEEITAAGEAVKIPMRGSVESLNVAVAAAIMLYEAARQRG